jgi:alginate O-acetyltransferase complex protein AlgI
LRGVPTIFRNPVLANFEGTCMVFSSRIFLFLFLPVVLAAYYASPRSLRNGWLLAVSLAFYAWGEPEMFWLFLVSIGANHLLGLGAEKTRGRNAGKWLIGLTIAVNIGLLAYFKYANFFVDSTNTLFAAWNFPTHAWREVALPIGISFYTFQAMSYVVDVYRGEVPAQRNPINTALYVAFFPQLIAGPIVRYLDVAAQIDSRRESIDEFSSGVCRFIIGLGKKVLLANSVAAVADAIFLIPDESLSCGVAWLGACCYTMQIYFDFSGYSDMAIGLGRMFGFQFLENFNYPYVSRSVTEFWRRWHISLSTWFRDYLYVPLGGNRGGRAKTYRNLMIVFLLCGLWHGAEWTFVAWGVYHGAFLIVERIGLLQVFERFPSPLRHLYALTVVVFGWALFRAETVGQAWSFWRAMLGGGAMPSTEYDLAPYVDSGLLLTLAACIVASLPISEAIRRRLVDVSPSRHTSRQVLAGALFRGGQVAAMGLVFSASAAKLMASTYNPFIYFRF